VPPATTRLVGGDGVALGTDSMQLQQPIVPPPPHLHSARTQRSILLQQQRLGICLGSSTHAAAFSVAAVLQQVKGVCVAPTACCSTLVSLGLCSQPSGCAQPGGHGCRAVFGNICWLSRSSSSLAAV